MEAQSIKIAAGKDEGECSRWGGEVANGNDDAEGRTETEKGEGEAKNSKNNSSSMMLGLLEEFTKIYADRLQRVEDTAMKCEEKQYLANKVCVLEGWVRDLGEQNSVLVVTVEELEREAACRVALLEDKLSKMAVTTRQSCLSLRDHQIQVTSLVRDKVGLENEAQGLREKLLSLEQRNTSLMEENTNLHSDLSNLLQVITRARQTGQWELDDLTFSCVTPEQVFGPVLSSSRRSSTSLKEIQSDYFHHLVEDQGLKKGSSSLASSFSNLQDAESSTYGGRGSEKDLMIMKLRAEVHNLQSAQEQANRHLVERDKQIADLQTQLTQNHQVLSTAHSEINNGKLGLTEVHHQSRKGNVEIELSNNIDSLIIRLREVENECRGLRDTNRSLQNTHQSLQDEHRTLQDSHTCCSSVVTTLQDQLAKSHEAQDELRTVLTAEVAQRHDQIVALRDELKGHEQQQHEKVMQLQLKSEVIKELRKELRVIREEPSATNPTKKDVDSEIRKMTSAHTQICETFTSTSKTQIIDEDTNKLPVNGMYSSTNQPPRLSKLENEVAEKSVLLRELQSHLAASRQELHLKDETLFKLEQKLDNSRRDGSEKRERMQYLTGQLTNLQLEVGRTHGQVEQLRRQVENKTDLIRKLEVENSSMTQQLNEKSNTLERYQTQLMNHSSDLDKKKREVCEQRLTISALQDALVSSKRACDQLRCRLDPDVSVGMTHSSISPKLVFASNNQPPTHSTATKSISPDDDFCPKIKLPSACTDHNSVNATGSSFHSPSANNNKLQCSMNDTSQNIVLSNFQNCSSVQPVDLYDCTATTEGNLPPDVRLAPQLDQENLCQSNTSAFTSDVLSSCGSNSFEMQSPWPDSQNPNVVNHSTMMPKSFSNNVNIVDGKISMERPQMKCLSGQVYDV